MQRYKMEHRTLPMLNQDLYAFVPYGAGVLSPIVPSQNICVPCAYTYSPYATVPLYQSSPPQQCNLSPSSTSSASSSATNMPNNLVQQMSLYSNSTNGNSNCISSGNTSMNSQNSLNDSNKINIQTCLSESNQLNMKSMNNMIATTLNFGQTNEKKDPSFNLCNTQTILPSDDAAGGDAANIHFDDAATAVTKEDNSTSELSQSKFNDFIKMALNGSAIAEKIAYKHRNRPCFKKIDSLCARMKQDLIRSDGVLSNINSQGIAWAVKDLIFVFTRIINAWIIIKGYVYNTPKGLNKIKAELSPDFTANFVNWQDTTIEFVQSVINSFISLDVLEQSQKNVYQKSDGITTARVNLLTTENTSAGDQLLNNLKSNTEKMSQNTLDKHYMYTLVEDSEDRQRQAIVNGTYFKTGTYNPIPKNGPYDAVCANKNIATSMPKTSSFENNAKEKLTNLWSVGIVNVDHSKPTTIKTSSDQLYDTFSSASNTVDYSKKYPNNYIYYDVNAENSSRNDAINLPVNSADKLNIMLQLLMAMECDDMFFKLEFTKNYFPEFVQKYGSKLTDVRSIILKCESGVYQSFFEAIYDVQKVIYYAREFLKTTENVSLQNAISSFEAEFNKLLKESPLGQ